MNFLSIDWADSDIELINIEYDHATMVIWNDALQKRLAVECFGFAGITDLCIWDDTIIMSANVMPVCDMENEFIQKLYTAYSKQVDYGGRFLDNGLLELKIELANHISFSIYCQSIKVSVTLDDMNK